MTVKNLPFILFFVFSVSNIDAAPDAKNLKVAKIFSDNMILQRDIKVPIWGWADAGGTVEVKFQGQRKDVLVDSTGRWMIKLEPINAGGPFEMMILGEKKIILKNIMMGDVWICGGQSNMAWPLRSAKNSKQELNDSNCPKIRLFTCPIATDQTPLEDLLSGAWQECSPKTAAGFSAVGYFFGRDLFRNLNVPIGLISSNVGGTAIELWMSRDYLQQEPDTKPIIDNFEKACANPSLQEKLKDFNEIQEKIASDIKKVRDSLPDVWTLIDFDDGAWEILQKQKSKTGKFHALMNIRKIIEIPKEWESKDLNIFIYYPMVYGHSALFFNGHPAKPTGEWMGHNFKKYSVEGKFVKAGKAVIAESAFTYQYENETQAGRSNSYVTVAGSDQKIMLSGDWKIKILDSFTPQSEPMHAKHRKALNGLYNAMINPIIPFAVKGVIWYQGEGNVSRADQYRKLLPLMIKCWRDNWKQGDIPFLIVQLANFGKTVMEPQDSLWAALREVQAFSSENVPNCGIITAIDIGESANIHPVNKQDVGLRLSLAARKIVYGQNDIVYSGPVYQSMKKEGNRIILNFKNVGAGLSAKGGKLKHFSIAGKDRKFVWADAVIEGNTIVVSNEKIADPVAVRYAWADNPEGCNLYNKEGFPAFPFRTDDWNEIPFSKKYSLRLSNKGKEKAFYIKNGAGASGNTQSEIPLLVQGRQYCALPSRIEEIFYCLAFLCLHRHE